MEKEKRSITNSNLSREKYIKKKIIKTLFFFDLAALVIGLMIILFVCIFKSDSDFFQMLRIILLLIIIFDFASIKFLYIVSSSDYDRAINLDLLNKSLSSETYTEIKPLHRIYEHSYFLVSLTNIAKFYAIIENESEVSIYVQFNTEDKLRFLEDIPKEKFYIRYKLQ